MSVVAGDILRITAVLEFDTTDDVVNVFHFEVDSNVSTDDDELMDGIAVFLDDLYTLVNPAMSELITYIDVQGQNVTQNVLLPSKDWPVLTVGLSTSTPLPSQVVANVFHRTTRPKTRATKKLGVFTEGQNDGNGRIGAGTVTILESFGTALLGPLDATTSVLFYGAYNTLLDRFTASSARVVPVRWGTLKKRRLGVGS